MKKEATYDLEERTTKLGTEILIFCKSLNLDTISRSIISQIVRSGTSIGANYMEANNASFKTRFLFARKNVRKLNIG